MWVKSADGRFAGSTSDGPRFTLTGGPKAGGKHGIIARARARKAAATAAEKSAELAKAEKGKPSAAKLKRIEKLRAALAKSQRVAEFHQKNAERIVRTGTGQIRPGLLRIANRNNERVALKWNGEGKQVRPSLVARTLLKRDAAKLALAREAHVGLAGLRLQAARENLASHLRSGKRIFYGRTSLGQSVMSNRQGLERTVAVRERAFAGRMKALARARAALGQK